VGSIDTCLDTVDGTNQQCFNLTAYNYDGVGPWDNWLGFVCVSMTESEVLNITFSSRDDYYMNASKVWVGEDIGAIPLQSDGNANTASFRYGDDELFPVQDYSVLVELDSADACRGKSGYTLDIAPYGYIGVPCTDKYTGEMNGTFIKNTDYPAWGQDVDNYQESVGEQYTWFTIDIKCDCVPSVRRRLEELPELPQIQEKEEDDCKDVFAYHGERSHGFNEVGLNQEDQHSQFAWGWSNGPLFSSHIGYKLEMVPHVSYSGEAIAQSVPLGKAKLQYSGSEAVLVMEAESNLWLKESHAYIGTQQLPHMDSNNTESINPFSYPLISSTQAEKESSHTFFAAMDLPRKKPVYLVAHATICGDFAAHEEIARHRGLKRSGRLRRRS
jgi:hypothetical protein